MFSYKLKSMTFSDRQSEPLLRPDAKDHSSSIFQQKETHQQRSDSISNPGENAIDGVFENGHIFQPPITSSSPSSLLLLPWFKNFQLKLSLFGFFVSICFV